MGTDTSGKKEIKELITKTAQNLYEASLARQDLKDHLKYGADPELNNIMEEIAKEKPYLLEFIDRWRIDHKKCITSPYT